MGGQMRRNPKEDAQIKIEISEIAERLKVDGVEPLGAPHLPDDQQKKNKKNEGEQQRPKEKDSDS